MFKIRNLTVLGQKRPLGIDVSPEFSYQTTENQLSRRIELFENNSLVWDSGVVFDDETANIKYTGKALKSKTFYSWRVTATGEDGTDTSATAITINPTKLELKRLSGAFALDKKLVDVAAPSLDGAVSNSIYSIIDEKVNEKLIGSMSAATLSASAGTTNYEKIVEAEGLLKDAKVHNIVYLYNPKDLLKLKAVSKKTNELPTSIIDIDGKIGGYSTFASSYVPQGTMYALNPQACWSNIAYVGLINDEFTLAHKGQNRVCVNVYGDAAVSNMAKNVAKIALA